MTTVAYDGFTLAADSQGTKDNSSGGSCPHCDSEVHQTHHNIRKVHRGATDVFYNEQRVIGWAGAGDANLIDALGYALKEGIALTEAAKLIGQFMKGLRRSASCTLLIVTEVTVWEVRCNSYMTVKDKEITQFPYAIGSGAPAARLAMVRYGLSAPAAAALSIDSDEYSGGEVCYLQCRNTTEHKVESYTYTEEDILELVKTK